MGRPKGSKNKPKVNSTPNNNAVKKNDKVEYISGASVSSTATSKQPTAAEMKKWYEENKKRLENYESANKAIDTVKNLRDVTKTSTKTVTAFSKDSLRSYLQNIGSNEKNLRNLSRYLYYRSQVYYRLVKYNANMFSLDCRSVIPKYDLVKENDITKTLKSYYETLKVLDTMKFQYEMLKAAVICFREDVFYGIAYYDDTGFFVLPFDPDFAKIDGVFSDGSFSYSIDMTYFRNRQDLLEMWGEPFTSMWSAYNGDNTNKWQSVPPEVSTCFKARAEDWDIVLPVFSGLLNSLINLIDLEDIQAIADEQQIYKMIWLEMETLTGSNQPDDWKVDPDIMIKYFNRMLNEALPEYTSAAIVPGKLNTISFDNDQSTDTNKIQKATQTVLNTSGGAQILNSASISGTTAFSAAIKSDTEFAISMLLPQFEAWTNRMLSYLVSNPSKVKFFEVSSYTKGELRKELLENGTYGLPTKLAINSISGFSELDTLSLNFLEEQCLNLSDKFCNPLVSSHVQSGNSDKKSGGQIKDDDQLTDDGEASRDKRDKK